MSRNKRARERDWKQKTFNKKSRTRQSEAEACDINSIMGKYRTTGFTKKVTLNTPVYGDFSNALDYMEAKNALIAADEIFMSLPARVRSRVNNDPAQLIAFVEDPENHDELVSLGLVEPVPLDSGSGEENPEVPDDQAQPTGKP